MENPTLNVKHDILVIIIGIVLILFIAIFVYLYIKSSNNITVLRKNVDDINKIVDVTNKSVHVNSLNIIRPGVADVHITNDDALTIYQTDDDGKRYYTKLLNHKNNHSGYNPDDYGYWYMSQPL